MSSSLFVYGGSFDPVHFGHLKTAQTIYDHFQPDSILFIPCKKPVLKNAAAATSEQRLVMLELAIACLQPTDAFAVDRFELDSENPSYMVNTLRHLRQNHPAHTAISLIMGIDAFQDLPLWHQWQSLIQLANLLIIKRPGYEEDGFKEELRQLLNRHQCADEYAILRQPAGNIVFFDAGEYPWSSTAIRKNPRQQIPQACPEDVREYILQYGLYK